MKIREILEQVCGCGKCDSVDEALTALRKAVEGCVPEERPASPLFFQKMMTVAACQRRYRDEVGPKKASDIRSYLLGEPRKSGVGTRPAVRTQGVTAG